MTTTTEIDKLTEEYEAASRRLAAAYQRSAARRVAGWMPGASYLTFQKDINDYGDTSINLRTVRDADLTLIWHSDWLDAEELPEIEGMDPPTPPSDPDLIGEIEYELAQAYNHGGSWHDDLPVEEYPPNDDSSSSWTFDVHAALIPNR